jgi:serine phosphatase RsbU (regulator of sigma subunit)/ligand-binding sensor domain-containing protein
MKKLKNILQLSDVLFICMIIILNLSTFSYGQRNYLFENISIPDGLSNSEVRYIYQDSNGFLWISTSDGLNRYNGNKIKVFKNDPNDPHSLPNNNCSAITEDSEGFIWIGVFGNAIARFNPKDESFISYPIETRNLFNISEYYDALYDSKGNLWFGSTLHGMQKFNRSKNKFEYTPVEPSNNNAEWGQIYAITELKNGNIIVADYGTGIKIYNEKLNLFQPYYLKTNFSPTEVATIYEDVSGNIWFGGKAKLIKYSPTYYSTDYYDVFSMSNYRTNLPSVVGLMQDNEGYIWAGVYSMGLYRVDPKTKDVKKFNFTSNSSNDLGKTIIAGIFKDKYGVMWIYTWTDGVTKFDPLREPFNYSKLKADENPGLGIDVATVIAGLQQGKDLTIGTSSRGLFSYDLENHNSSKLKINFDPATIINGNIEIQSLAVDENGNRWFSYNNLGLHKLDKTNRLASFKSPHLGKTTSYAITELKIDLAGNVWSASESGFEIYNPTTNEFKLLPTIMTKKISDNLKREISKISKSQEPIASILKVGEASNLEKKFSLKDDQKVLIVCLGEGRIIQGNDGVFDTGSILTQDGKTIWSMNDLSETYYDGGGFKNRIAIKSLHLKKGDYKITFATDVGHSYGTWNVLPPPDSAWYGIQVLKLNDSEYKNISELNSREINSDKYLPMEMGTCFEFSKRLYNVVWLGSRNNSFFKYDLSTGNYKQYNFDTKIKYSPNNSITYIYEDREGIVWIATMNYLMRFDPVAEKIEKYSQKEGLPSNLVYSIIEDATGNLWINTSAGLSKLNKNAPKEKWNFVNYDSRDGLKGFSSSKASWISKDGEIILGTNDGITSFYPGKINEIKPDVVLEDIKVSDISLKSDTTVIKLEKSIMKLDELNLSYTQNNISFEFESIHYSRPEKNKIIYKLDGFNNEWKSTDRNYVAFTNLAPGEYTFRIKGSNGDGIWNEEGKTLRIIISPPWWKTTAAYFGYFFSFVGIIFGIDRVQRRRILSKERNAAAIKEANLRAQLAETENERKTKELEEARQLQLSMLPKTLPQLPHLDIAVYMKTATEVGGDYYDFNVGMDGALTVVIGDATGHGMKAGTMVTSAKSLFNSYAANPDILFTFHEMTRCIKQMQFQSLAMSMTMLKIQNNRLIMSAAGMPPVYLFRNKHKIIEEYLMEGMPLGTMDNFPYELKEMELFKGDTILLMSDGFPELQNQNDEVFGYKRVKNSFEEVAEKEPERIINYLKEAGSRWTKDEDPDDDVTFVVIKVK